MELFLIDAIGPFFRNYKKSRINWSKIPFSHLRTSGPEATQQWQRIHQVMRDFFGIILLARRYYFLPFDESLAEQIRIAKINYKNRYPSTERDRYRIKVSFTPFHIKRRTLSWASIHYLSNPPFH